MIIFFLLSKNILFVGDSHTEGYFGQNLKKNLTQSNNTVKVLAKAGSGVAYWTINEQFVDQVKSTDEVIIALGTNDFASYQNCNKKTSCIKNKIQEMINLIPPGKKCTWIGPPQYQKGSFKEIPYSDVQYVIKALKDTLINSKCTFIDSSDCTLTRANPNDVHFNKEQSRVWSDCIAKQMNLLLTPEVTKPKIVASKDNVIIQTKVIKNTPPPSPIPPNSSINIAPGDNCKYVQQKYNCSFFEGSLQGSKIAYLNNIRGALKQEKKIPAVCVDFFNKTLQKIPCNNNNGDSLKELRALEIMESARQASVFLEGSFISNFYQQLSFYGITQNDKTPENIFSKILNSPLTKLEVMSRCPAVKFKGVCIDRDDMKDLLNKKILYFEDTSGEYRVGSIIQYGDKRNLYSRDFSNYIEDLNQYATN
jgi:hypothetical protein